MAGLQAVDGLVAPQQQVAVRLLDVVPEELLLRIDRIVRRVLVNDRARQLGHVGGRRVVLGMRQPGGIHEMGVVHTQALGSRVHQVREGLLAAGDMLGQRYAGIVAGLDDHAMQQVAHRDLAVDLDEHARAARAPGLFAHSDHVAVADLPLLDFQGGDVGGHQLRQARRRQALVAIVFHQHVAAGGIHQQIGLGGQLRW